MRRRNFLIGLAGAGLASFASYRFGVWVGQNNPKPSDSEPPIAAVTISFAEGERAAFLERLRELADENSFAIRIASVGSTDNVFVQMFRDDLHVILANPSDRNAFDVGVYRGKANGSEFSSKTFLASLERLIEKIPGGKMTDRKASAAP